MFYPRVFSVVIAVALFSLSPLPAFSGGKGEPPAPLKPVMAVSILPQAYFAGYIGGDRIQTIVLAGPGQNPHTYEPSPKQMADLAGAGAWILSGTEFEISLRPKIEALFPKLRIIDGTRGVRFRTLEVPEEEDPDHPQEGDLSIDRHTWLGAEPAKIMAAHIRDACTGLDPGGAAWYGANYEALIGEIDGEFRRLKQELEPLRGKAVFVYHPAFGYFLDEFGIRQEAVETGGKEPTPRILNALIARARREGAAAIFVQAQFPVNAARTVAASVGAELIALDPLSPDWLANIRIMGAALQKALGEGR
ncbi:MAG: zinc ABC transporter substrate-binding protein [Treponema sp.]|nr:zinc ABC transporter substrate-binding protein [Treponema sp.]